MVRDIIRRTLPDAQVQVFGSRATGKARPYSVLDLLFVHPSQLPWHVRCALLDAFESSNLPFCVDLVESDNVPPGMLQRIRAESQPLTD